MCKKHIYKLHDIHSLFYFNSLYRIVKYSHKKVSQKLYFSIFISHKLFSLIILFFFHIRPLLYFYFFNQFIARIVSFSSNISPALQPQFDFLQRFLHSGQTVVAPGKIIKVVWHWHSNSSPFDETSIIWLLLISKPRSIYIFVMIFVSVKSINKTDSF